MAKVLWSADRRIWKDNGDPAADGTVAIRLADTSTPATVYSDRSLSVSLGSSVNIGSDGYLESDVTIYGADDVGYDIVITATGVNGGAAWTIPDVAIADSSVAADSYRTGFKNVVNNGDFAVWSDQTSYSNISGDDNGVETADGWFFAQPSAASNAVSRQTGEATASRYGQRFGRPAASTSTNKLRVWKMLTTEEVYRLRGQTVVFSVYLRSGANFSAASLNCKLATGTSEGEDGDLIESGGLAGFAQPINQNQAITTSITRYSFSATLGATIKEAGVQFSYTGVGTAGANDWVQIEQVQVEIATTVSEFEAIPETLEFLIGKLSTAGRALAKLGTAAADKIAYFTSASAAAYTDFTSVARTLLAQTTQAAMRTTGLGLSSGASSLVTDSLLTYGVFAGSLYGMTASNNGSDATNDIDFAPGRCTDSTSAALIVTTATITKQLDAAWAAGSAAGGLDAGSIANATYHCHAIKKDSDGTGDFIYSLSHDKSATCTMTIASPAVVTMTAHGLVAGSPIKFSTTGALPTGVTAGTQYYVISTSLTADTFRFSTSIGGSAVNTSGSQSGVHTCLPGPVMPSGYTYFRRIASILREGGAIVGFVQDGDLFVRKTGVRDINATTSGTSAVSRTLSVPVGIRVAVRFNTVIVAGVSGEDLYISDLSQTDNAGASPSLTINCSASTRMWAANQEVMTNTSAQIRSRQSVGGASETFAIYTMGWRDTRGRLA